MKTRLFFLNFASVCFSILIWQSQPAFAADPYRPMLTYFSDDEKGQESVVVSEKSAVVNNEKVDVIQKNVVLDQESVAANKLIPPQKPMTTLLKPPPPKSKEVYQEEYSARVSASTPTDNLQNANIEQLTPDERDLFESMKTKMFLLEREKAAAHDTLTNIRQKEIGTMKVEIGSRQKIQEQAEKIRILQEKLQQYQYAQIHTKRDSALTRGGVQTRQSSDIVENKPQSETIDEVVNDLVDGEVK